jgi:uncharacterized protein (DUF433 family)
MLDTTKRDMTRHKETRGDMATNGTAMSEDAYVAEYPGVCGGYPVIRETRIPVRLVVQLSRAGATLKELGEMWPTVTAAQIQGALDYYTHHPRRIDEDIERNARASLSAHSVP